ncbi:MAG: hypothetical protein AAF617_11950 [Bacteroidota bacterium]
MQTPEITYRITENKKLIVKALNENIDLNYELTLRKGKSFENKKMNRGTTRKPDFVNVKLMHYDQQFMDEDTGKPFTIERLHIVEIEGKKSDGWKPIEYYSLENL